MPNFVVRYIKVKNDPIDYTNGKNINNLVLSRNTILSSYYEDTYLIDDVIYEKNTGRVYRWKDMEKVNNYLPNTKEYKRLLEEQQIFFEK
ncbi:MAG: hypothetical protein CSA26_04470 [Desulfobacterales bacterium]|nr:MAG: hypothetical protein CSA26_04470 [Desulfobacterales bacterium]